MLANDRFATISEGMHQEDLFLQQEAGKQYLKRLLNRRRAPAGGSSPGKDGDQLTATAGTAPNAVKNLVKRNGRVLHLAQ